MMRAKKKTGYLKRKFIAVDCACAHELVKNDVEVDIFHQVQVPVLNLKSLRKPSLGVRRD